LTDSFARQAAEFARQWHQPRANPDKKLSGADAAAAVRFGCNYLMTHDKGFPLGRAVHGVEVIQPAEVGVWRTLFDESTTPRD
jgi:hypothetical protein